MLCRTASDLYWMARQVERAENTARLVDLTQRIALLPGRLSPGGGRVAAWSRALDALGLMESYAAQYGEITPAQVAYYLTLDTSNPASIRSAWYTARELGRAQRGAITSEMFKELNTSWLELYRFDREWTDDDSTGSLPDWVKTQSAAFRGVTDGTMGRDEGYRFMALGTHVERADNTVRLLDVRYAQFEHMEPDGPGDFVQYYQWSALLQAMSAFETYRKFYHDAVRPLRVAEMMIFDRRMPRSLSTCCGILLRCLSLLAGKPDTEAERRAGALASRLRYGTMDEVLELGMRGYLEQFMQELNGLTHSIIEQFMTSIGPLRTDALLPPMRQA